jgi:hypothetical protein
MADLLSGARLGIADHLANGPMTAAGLADACGTHSLSLLRLLRALTTIDVLHEEEDGRFAITAFGSLLSEGHPQSMRDVALRQGSPETWAAWGDFHGAVVSGDCAFERVHGMPLFEYLARHPECGAQFNRIMTTLSRTDVAHHLAPIDLGDARTVVDIAGGDGYLMKRILHDWNDEGCLRLLRNCRAAIAPTGRLLVIDDVVGPSNVPDLAKWLDLSMLAITGGRERTEPEFRELFAQAGFTLTGIVPSGRTFVVEGIPA